MERYCYAPWIMRQALRVLDRESRRRCLEAEFAKADERALHRVVTEQDLRGLLLQLDDCFGGGEIVPRLLARSGDLSPARIALVLRACVFVDEDPESATWSDFMANANGRQIATDLVRRLLDGVGKLEDRLETFERLCAETVVPEISGGMPGPAVSLLFYQYSAAGFVVELHPNECGFASLVVQEIGLEDLNRLPDLHKQVMQFCLEWEAYADTELMRSLQRLGETKRLPLMKGMVADLITEPDRRARKQCFQRWLIKARTSISDSPN